MANGNGNKGEGDSLMALVTIIAETLLNHATAIRTIMGAVSRQRDELDWVRKRVDLLERRSGGKER